jgi:hypothetical protein
MLAGKQLKQEKLSMFFRKQLKSCNWKLMKATYGRGSKIIIIKFNPHRQQAIMLRVAPLSKFNPGRMRERILKYEHLMDTQALLIKSQSTWKNISSSLVIKKLHSTLN